MLSTLYMNTTSTETWTPGTHQLVIVLCFICFSCCYSTYHLLAYYIIYFLSFVLSESSTGMNAAQGQKSLFGFVWVWFSLLDPNAYNSYLDIERP